MSNKNKKTITIIVVTAIMLVLGGVGVMAYNTPYAYVSLDVNPSFEFTVNIFNRVIKVNAVNEDASEIIVEGGAKEFCNRDITKAISNALSAMINRGYLKEKDVGVVIATSNENLARRLNIAFAEFTEYDLREDEKPILITPSPSATKPALEQETSTATEIPDPTPDPADVPTNGQTTAPEEDDDIKDTGTIIIICIGKDRVERARELGITLGKLNIIERLRDAMNDDNFSIEDWIDKPVKDIMKKIKDLRKTQPLLEDQNSNNEPATENPNQKNNTKAEKQENGKDTGKGNKNNRK